MRATLIVAAGGIGARFRQTLPRAAAKKEAPLSKLFYPLRGKPLILRTLQAFEKIPQIREIIVTFPPGAKPSLERLFKGYARPLKFVAGGKTRAESVLNALRQSNVKNEWVLVHDGARPLVSGEAVKKLLAATGAIGGEAVVADGAILAKKVTPTIKEVAQPRPEVPGTGARHRCLAPMLAMTIVRTLDRSSLYEAETPQLIRRSVLTKAYAENPDALQATDEASLVESLRGSVKIVTHDGWNPKITTAQDLELAEAYLSKTRYNENTSRQVPAVLLRCISLRTGFGRDTHRLVKGRKFYLGGVRIPFDKGPLGHSDGDALLHAVTDAILGAVAAGDIGEWFSDKDRRHKNIRSAKMLAAVLKDAAKRGFRPVHVDTVTSLERPKLSPYKKSIRRNLAKLLGLPESNCSVKAKTMEGLGPVGEGLAVTCEAIVTMQKAPGPLKGAWPLLGSE